MKNILYFALLSLALLIIALPASAADCSDTSKRRFIVTEGVSDPFAHCNLPAPTPVPPTPQPTPPTPAPTPPPPVSTPKPNPPVPSPHSPQPHPTITPVPQPTTLPTPPPIVPPTTILVPTTEPRSAPISVPIILEKRVETTVVNQSPKQEVTLITMATKPVPENKLPKKPQVLAVPITAKTGAGLLSGLAATLTGALGLATSLRRR